LISIPLGIFKAVKRGSVFDVASSALIFILYSVPAFMLAILMVVSMGPGGLDWFPIQGLASENYESLDLMGKIVDRIRHAVMPLLAYTIGGYATLTILMKNSLIEELGKDYVRTARAKGLTERLVIGRHAFRNALMPSATGLGSVLSVFLAGSLLLETIFNLDGIGLLGYQSVLSRDFNVIMGIAMLSSFAALFGNLLSDITYVLIDPRIDFSAAAE
jgi:microcin C transport system permease protein